MNTPYPPLSSWYARMLKSLPEGFVLFGNRNILPIDGRPGGDVYAWLKKAYSGPGSQRLVGSSLEGPSKDIDVTYWSVLFGGWTHDLHSRRLSINLCWPTTYFAVRLGSPIYEFCRYQFPDAFAHISAEESQLCQIEDF